MTTLSKVNQPSRWVTYTLHTVALLVALAFLLTGGTKLMGVEMHVENFARWGYPDWFMYLTGLIEVSGAILIVLPKTRFYGALLLVATMVGAILTHIQADEIAAMPVPIVLLLLAASVAWMNKPVQR